MPPVVEQPRNEGNGAHLEQDRHETANDLGPGESHTKLAQRADAGDAAPPLDVRGFRLWHSCG